ncbi:AraC family transcriptional regulator [Vibrio splendidus]|uniref:AraC family transcriptional regulator n=1 Tax=Vibrio splendidus TaxID=29497 RepID=UPI001112FA3E|nr:AraC family transcriptional regulator [Vibrio splendidus]
MSKAKFEKVPQRQGLSWRYLKTQDSAGFYDWHYHQEFELVLHRHAQGVGFAGHYQGKIVHNALWLIAPGTPHAFDCKSSSTEFPPERHSIWIKRDWIANIIFNCFELRKLDTVLKRAQKGIMLSKLSGERVFLLINELTNNTHINQLAILIQILGVIAEDKAATNLLSFSTQNLTDANSPNIASDRSKVENLSHYIENNYHLPITLADLSLQLSTSESSIHRIFEAHFHESFSQHLKKLRLNHAAELLTHSDLAINLIAEKVGYHNQANFNRLFKRYKLVTPSQYRKQFKV